MTQENDLWDCDVGQDAYEEIDRLPAGVAGANFGWSCREGPSTYVADRCRRGRAYLGPQWSYRHSYGESVVGGFAYRGTRFAASIGGAYLGGDDLSGRVFLGTTGGLRTVGRLPKVTSFGQDDNREL